MSPPPPRMNLSTPNLFSLFPTTPLSVTTLHNPKPSQSQIPLLSFPRKATSFASLFPPHSFQAPLGQQQSNDVFQEEEHLTGDCLVFEEGIFDDPFLQETRNPRDNPGMPRRRSTEGVKVENLIPEEWAETQKEINITKKERRRLAQQMEFGRRVEKRRQALRPVGDDGSAVVEEYVRYSDVKSRQLKPEVLDNPYYRNKDGEDDDDVDEEEAKGTINSVSVLSGRVTPRNPWRAVYGGGLDDITEFFNSGQYDPDGTKESKGTRKLFTKEEKILLNRRIPDLESATSGKWQPLHTLAASGEFYLVNSLLKHNVDINTTDKDGMAAIHRAILGKKQAIFNYLLRESANPFIRDKDGASFMHYAVRTASSQMIKILLLYNVDINLPDDDGWTPLHLAVQSRRTDVVRLLLIKGADKTLRNHDGLTPLDICLHYGRDPRTYELIKLLKKPPKDRRQIPKKI